MRKNLLLLFFTLLFIFASLEAALLIINPEKTRFNNSTPKTDWALVPERVWIEHDSQLGWTHQKNKVAALKRSEFGEILLHINSAGLRGIREYQTERPVGVKRIAMVGDSFLFGWGVHDEETVAAKLESRAPTIEALNFGVPGYGIDQIYLSYKLLARQYKPDYVVVCVFPEDFWRATRAFADTGHAKPYFKLNAAGDLELQNVPVPQPFTLNTNQFPDLIEYGGIEKILMKSISYRYIRRKVLKLAKNLGWVDPESADEWIVGREIIKHLVGEIKQDGAKPLFLIVAPERWMSQTKPDSLHRSLLRLAARENIPMIDLDPVFKEAVKKSKLSEYFIPEDRHWTAKGHELAAKVIADYFNQNGYEI